MSSAARRTHLMTVEEFQDWRPDPDQEGWRWQLADGEVIGMAPASNAHNAILTRTASILDNHVAKADRCVVLTTPGVIPRRRSKINQLVPDIGVSCVEQPDDNTIREPVLLVEILSPSNLEKTRANIYAFQTIASVQDILVIDSRAVTGSLHRRDAQGEWPDEPETLDAHSMVALRCIGLEVAMRDFYATSRLRVSD